MYVIALNPHNNVINVVYYTLFSVEGTETLRRQVSG